ncbi:MAG: hypothetical protein HN368_23850, partial [Spirochaetales bacterium]|nr:hypothetical protein [Spirochaetales bacterium]
MNNSWYENWLVGANGVYLGGADGTWERIGKFDFQVNAMLRTPNSIIAGVYCGVWQITVQNGTWLQLHDETFTEALALAPHTCDAGVLAACPYGIATADRDDLGAYRWKFHSNGLRVNERFTNAVLQCGESAGTYLIGTESGVLFFDNGRWERTNLSSGPVRALLRAHS